MASDWTDWADGNDLAGMSRSTSPLTSAGYDPDEVRANPALRQQVMQQVGSLYGLQPRTMAANGPVTPALDIRNAAPTAAVPQPIPNAAVKAPTLIPAAATSQQNLPSLPQSTTGPQSNTPAPVRATPVPQQNVSELDSVGREALEKGLSLGNFAQQNAEALANADPGTAALEAQAAKDATPTPYLDPTTGKPLESAKQYEPTGMQKFERGLKGAAIGFLTGGPFGAGVGAIDPGLVHGGTAYDAPNAAYNATEAAREQRLAGDQAAIAGLKDRFKAMTDARKAANTAAGTAATAFGDVDKGVSSMQPKPDKDGAPQTMLVNGKPALVNWDPQKGYLNAAPGPNFGQPVQGTVSEPPPEPKEATDAFHEWLNNPGQYEKFAKTMAGLKSEKGAYGSFGPAFLAYHLLNTAYGENPALLPALAPLLAKMMSSAGGTVDPQEISRILSQAPAGQPRDASGAPIGLRQPGAPTGASRSRGQFAESVLPSVDAAKTEIGTLGKDLGPLSGRWLDFYQGRVGADNPKYAGLSTSLHNIATAWMRLHANSDSARQEFEHALRTAQTPADLVASLNSLETQAKDYVKEGQGRPDLLKKEPGSAGGGTGDNWAAQFPKAN